MISLVAVIRAHLVVVGKHDPDEQQPTLAQRASSSTHSVKDFAVVDVVGIAATVLLNKLQSDPEPFPVNM